MMGLSDWIAVIGASIGYLAVGVIATTGYLTSMVCYALSSEDDTDEDPLDGPEYDDTHEFKLAA